MSIVILVVQIIWIIRIVRNILSYAHLWYVKEYRWDRMFIHFQTSQGRRWLFIPGRLPPLSMRSMFIVCMTFIIMVWAYWICPLSWWAKLMLLDVGLMPVMFFVVLLSHVPMYLYHRLVITKATKLLQAHRPMNIIGITGSYGKTSTKEYLWSILRAKYRVLKTRDSKNSPIGIAEVIIKELTAAHDMFIVEMGAYRPGEIARMTRLVKPQIGIITAINPQHQDLFRTIETTKRAKYELVQGLVGDKIVIVNADTPGSLELAGRAKSDGYNVRSYSIVQKNTDWYATNIKASWEAVSFTVHYKSSRKDLTVSLLGSHHVQNILAAMAAAHAVGMTFDEICGCIGNITPLPKTMQPVHGTNRTLFINDTFNNNPDAALAAITFLKNCTGAKYLVFQPMIELGSYAHESHVLVGKSASLYCDSIILTNDNFYKPFIEGVHSTRKNVQVAVMNRKKARDYLISRLQPGDTVLFKGKEAEGVLLDMPGVKHVR